MPNHFTTICICSGNWEGLEQSGQDDFDLSDLEGADLCERVCPRPDVFNTISSENVPTQYIHKATGEPYPNPNGPPHEDRNNYKRVPVSKDDLASIRNTYGAVDWYEWANKNWGTKWGTYQTNVRYLSGDGAFFIVEFVSAWGPPKPEIMGLIAIYLRDKYFLDIVKCIGCDPGSNTIMPVKVLMQKNENR